jgi:hypothetical protein
MPKWIAETYAITLKQKDDEIKDLKRLLNDLEDVVSHIGDTHEGYMVLRENEALRDISAELQANRSGN